MTDRRPENERSRADDDLGRGPDASRSASKPGADFQPDDRGGSRDGERLEAGEAGDRDQLDDDGGRTPSRR